MKPVKKVVKKEKVVEKEKMKFADVSIGHIPVDELGQPLVGVKVDKLAEGEIEGSDPIIKE